MKNFLRALGTRVLEKAAEKTTWAGVPVLVASAGVAVSPENVALIVAVGTALAGMILVAMNDTK